MLLVCGWICGIKYSQTRNDKKKHYVAVFCSCHSTSVMSELWSAWSLVFLRVLSFSSNDDRWRPSVRHTVHSADTEVGKEELLYLLLSLV